MSDSTQIPPGNRPPAPRVFRPFAGGASGQGSPSPTTATGANAMARRPAQPRRPFVSAQTTDSASAPVLPDARAPLVATVDVPEATEVVPTQPMHEAASVEHEAWSRVVEAEPLVFDLPAEPIVEKAPLGNPPPVEKEPQAVTLEVPQLYDEEPAPSFSEATLSPREKTPVVTAEVLAIPSAELEVPVVASQPEPDPLDAPRFVAPASEPPADSLIDEVDAAFITAGLPSSGDAAPSDDVIKAAATLEAIARRLRAGEIELRPATGATMSSAESALATVLAALLANR